MQFKKFIRFRNGIFSVLNNTEILIGFQQSFYKVYTCNKAKKHVPVTESHSP